MILKDKKLWLDSILATIFIFALMYFAVKFLAIFEFLDPISEAVSGMEITDQVFSNPSLRELPPADTNIVIVNIGLLPRRGIAEQVNIINKYNPKAIGLDSFFRTLKEDTLGDLMLAEAFSNVENLVIGSKLTDPDDNDMWQDSYTSHEIFAKHAMKASVNLIVEEANQDQNKYKTCRSFFPQEKLYDSLLSTIRNEPAFAVKLADIYNPEKVQKLLSRELEEEVINYRGNVMDFGRSNFGTRYFALDVYDVLDENFTPDLIEGKIVLMGFLGESFGDSRSFDDKYFTPLNAKYAGRADLDMFGVVVHANVVSMILNEDYIDQNGDTSAFIFAVLMCFINVFLFSMIYRKLPQWYDGLTKIIQLVEIILLLFIIVMVFHYYSFKLNLTIGIVAVLFSADSLEVYYGVIKNLFNAKRRRQLFTITEKEV
jgi:CHASE2 domain-containing sensor protein